MKQQPFSIYCEKFRLDVQVQTCTRVYREKLWRETIVSDLPARYAGSGGAVAAQGERGEQRGQRHPGGKQPKRTGLGR